MLGSYAMLIGKKTCPATSVLVTQFSNKTGWVGEKRSAAVSFDFLFFLEYGCRGSTVPSPTNTGIVIGGDNSGSERRGSTFELQ